MQTVRYWEKYAAYRVARLPHVGQTLSSVNTAIPAISSHVPLPEDAGVRRIIEHCHGPTPACSYGDGNCGNRALWNRLDAIGSLEPGGRGPALALSQPGEGLL